MERHPLAGMPPGAPRSEGSDALTASPAASAPRGDPAVPEPPLGCRTALAGSPTSCPAFPCIQGAPVEPGVPRVPSCSLSPGPAGFSSDSMGRVTQPDSELPPHPPPAPRRAPLPPASVTGVVTPCLPVASSAPREKLGLESCVPAQSVSLCAWCPQAQCPFAHPCVLSVPCARCPCAQCPQAHSCTLGGLILPASLSPLCPPHATTALSVPSRDLALGTAL